jgi:putative transcriptional regulator
VDSDSDDDDGSLAPGLLVAMPQLLDPHFKRSVVLVVHHDGEGAFGLVLSRHSEIPADELCASVGLAWGGDASRRVSWGGPVQPDTGWVLVGDDGALVADDPADDLTEIARGLHFAGSLATLKRVAGEPPPELRLFLGYAGWGPGQLENELSQGSWLLAPVSRDHVFHVAPDVLWERVLRDLGIDPSTLVPTTGVH